MLALQSAENSLRDNAMAITNPIATARSREAIVRRIGNAWSRRADAQRGVSHPLRKHLRMWRSFNGIMKSRHSRRIEPISRDTRLSLKLSHGAVTGTSETDPARKTEQRIGSTSDRRGENGLNELTLDPNGDIGQQFFRPWQRVADPRHLKLRRGSLTDWFAALARRPERTLVAGEHTTEDRRRPLPSL
jgi:hypothetical protein